jgi:hypothetical protein
VVVGGAVARQITVTNVGKVALEGVWSLRGEGFGSDDGVPSRADVGETIFTVRCAPERVGLFDGSVSIEFAGYQPLVIPLACEGVGPPACVPSGRCKRSAWDVAAGRCVERNAPDDEACLVGDACLVDARCHAGRCEGTPRVCNDGDPCTADACDPQVGCQHPGPISCPNDGPCRVGRCVAGLGCALADAPDGTPCGARRSCVEADVCIAGRCEVRDPPDGFECSAAGPCGGAGRCVNDQCVGATATTLTPSWSLGAPQPDGGPRESWSDLVADRSGGVHLSSYFVSAPRLDARAMPIDLMSTARRCVAWHGWLVCGDLPPAATAPITAVDVTTGATVWSFTGVHAQIAEFNGPRVEVFTARLAVLNENELLALWESRTMTDAGADPRCRVFAIVVLDRAGQALRSTFIRDPIFSVCNHQHSYGVAVDAQSNVYLAFSPSDVDNPATALRGTTIFSYSPALQLRWRVFDANLEGGELATAHGSLFHEGSTDVRSTATGAPTAQLSDRFGLGVIGEQTSVAVRPGSNQLEALRLPPAMQGWRFPLSAPVDRTPLTVATWDSPWGPREVAMAFTDDQARVRLEAVELLTGAPAFSCDVALPDAPLMTAMTDEGLVVMNGFVPRGPRCSRCDPKYAGSKNQFALLPLPGVRPSVSSAWPAAWGSEGHSHHEGR